MNLLFLHYIFLLASSSHHKLKFSRHNVMVRSRIHIQYFFLFTIALQRSENNQKLSYRSFNSNIWSTSKYSLECRVYDVFQ